MATVLHALGYPTAVVVLARWLPVVRQRRWAWFAAHQAGVAAITAGWWLKGDWRGVVPNAGWFVVAAGWFLAGGRGAQD